MGYLGCGGLGAHVGGLRGYGMFLDAVCVRVPPYGLGTPFAVAHLHCQTQITYQNAKMHVAQHLGGLEEVSLLPPSLLPPRQTARSPLSRPLAWARPPAPSRRLQASPV